MARGVKIGVLLGPSRQAVRRRLLLCLACLGLCCAGLCSCDQKTPAGGPGDPSRQLLERLEDPTLSADERIARIAAEGRPENFRAVRALLRILKDRSQINFLVERDDQAPFGYKAVEFKQVSAQDTQALDRTMAVCALERIGSAVGICDLVAALKDRSPWVRSHAARALLHFGIRSGMPVLFSNLAGRAEANETANRILKQVSGQDFGFDSDIGWKARNAAIERWRAWWKKFAVSGQSLPGEGRVYNVGMDPEADLRIRFFTDVMGQFQKKYSEEARNILTLMGAVALPFLREAQDRARAQSNHPLAAAVAWVLGGLDDQRVQGNVQRLLLELLRYPGQGTVRSRAARSLARRGARKVVPALARSLVEDGDTEVRLEILRALGRLGGPEAVAALQGFDPEGDPDLEDARILGLFEATGGSSNQALVLDWLARGAAARRNEALEVLQRVTGHAVALVPESTAQERSRFAQTYRSLLKR